jgi:hypothetical protein
MALERNYGTDWLAAVGHPNLVGEKRYALAVEGELSMIGW